MRTTEKAPNTCRCQHAAKHHEYGVGRCRCGCGSFRSNGDSVPIMLSRGSAVLPQAMLDRYGDMLAALTPNTDFIAVEDILAEENDDAND